LRRRQNRPRFLKPPGLGPSSRSRAWCGPRARGGHHARRGLAAGARIRRDTLARRLGGGTFPLAQWKVPPIFNGFDSPLPDPKTMQRKRTLRV
jgi:hypothetical protein